MQSYFLIFSLLIYIEREREREKSGHMIYDIDNFKKWLYKIKKKIHSTIKIDEK